MGEATKTDNARPGAKLELRRHFLRRYHAAGADVLDCCQGGGVLWQTLLTEFPVRSYWGLDVKPKKGRLKLDSVRVLQQPGWPQNVIDVDTYGLPWKHWFALLPNVVRPLTVFLTLGSVASGLGSPASREELRALGLDRLKTKLPPAFTVKVLRELAVPCCLAERDRFGLRIVEAVEATAGANARYFGLRLEPIPAATPTV